MTLKEYKKRQRLKQRELAEMLDVTPFYIRKLLSEKSFPSRSLAIKIENKTYGAVSKYEAMFPE